MSEYNNDFYQKKIKNAIANFREGKGTFHEVIDAVDSMYYWTSNRKHLIDLLGFSQGTISRWVSNRSIPHKLVQEHVVNLIEDRNAKPDKLTELLCLTRKYQDLQDQIESLYEQQENLSLKIDSKYMGTVWKPKNPKYEQYLVEIEDISGETALSNPEQASVELATINDGVSLFNKDLPKYISKLITIKQLLTYYDEVP